MEGFSISGSSISKTSSDKFKADSKIVKHQSSQPKQTVLINQSSSNQEFQADSKSSIENADFKSIRNVSSDTALYDGAKCDSRINKVYRPKDWSNEVENAFRLQLAGYKDTSEYAAEHGLPDKWDDENAFIKCLIAKKTGYFMYFRKSRECEDKHVNRVLLYS